MSQVLDDFIKNSFQAGKTRQEINSALLKAGWQSEQLDPVWASYHNQDFPVPVPMPRAYVSPRYAMLNLFFFLILLMTIWAGDSILFTFLDYYLPDGLGRRQGLYYSTQSIGESLRHYLATLIVCAPLLVMVGRFISRTAMQGTQSTPPIRLKLIYIMFFLAAFVMLTDFILFVYYFLSGELGIRFILKVAVCSVTALGLYYFYKPETGSAEKKL